jgi:hypothetical protein
MSVEKRRVDELAQILALEPSVKEIIVEGPGDVGILSWFLGHYSDGFKVTPIEYFETDDLDFDQFKTKKPTIFIQNNNRGRVLLLTDALETLVDQGVINKSIWGLIDKDLDPWISGEIPSNRFLLVTDVSSMEMYAMTEPIIDKFFKLHAPFGEINATQLVLDLQDVLAKLFLERIAKLRLDFNVEEPEFNYGAIDVLKCITWSGQGLSFKEASLQENIRSKAKSALHFDRLMEEIKKLQDTVAGPAATRAHGKDFTMILRYLLAKQRANTSLKHPEQVRDALFSIVRIEDLLVWPLFSFLGTVGQVAQA